MRSLIPEDVYAIRVINDLEIAPNGQTVAYVLSTFDRKRDREFSAIWTVDVATGESRQITSGENRESAPHWAPDGRTLAYTRVTSVDAQQSDRDIYTVDTDTWSSHKKITRGGYTVDQFT